MSRDICQVTMYPVVVHTSVRMATCGITTNFVESSNKSLQYSVVAPKITNTLYRAGDKSMQYTYETHRRRQTEAVDMIQKSPPTTDGGVTCHVTVASVGEYVFRDILAGDTVSGDTILYIANLCHVTVVT